MSERQYMEAVITVVFQDGLAPNTKVYRVEFEALRPSAILDALEKGQWEHFKIVYGDGLPTQQV